MRLLSFFSQKGQINSMLCSINGEVGFKVIMLLYYFFPCYCELNVVYLLKWRVWMFFYSVLCVKPGIFVYVYETRLL